MLTHDDLKRLAAVSGPCLTIFEPLRSDYAPAARPQAGVTAALHRGERLLTDNGLAPADRDEMLRPLLTVAAETDWASQKGSVAMFRSPGFTLINFWPDALPPRVHFGQEFLLLPLLPGLQSKRDFWLLTLSVKAVRLFRGSCNGLIEVVLPRGIPRSIDKYDALDRHDIRAGFKPDYRHDFFRAIDRAIHPILSGQRQPLILAGVTRDLAVYRRVNTYADVLAGAIHGSPETLGADALYARAMDLMAAYSGRATATTLSEIEEAAGRGLMVTDPAAVIEAANKGRVEKLIVSPAAPAYETREELINWAALATIRHSGRISVMSGHQPEVSVSAIVRYTSRQKEKAVTF